MRGALIGCGSVARFHLRAWADAGAEIVAVADPLPERTTVTGVPRVYASGEELLERERLDFVDVATGPYHRLVVRVAAARGVPVLCQKPFAASLEAADDLLASLGETRCIVNENWRWRAWYRTIYRLVVEGAIGTPRLARFTWHGDEVLPTAAGPPPLLVRQPYLTTAPHLLLLEWGIHLIDVLRLLLGEVVDVSAEVGRRSPQVAGEDWARVRLRFAGGAVGELDLSWSTPTTPDRRLPRGCVEPFVLEGDAGRIELDPFADDRLIVSGRATAARGDRTRAEAYQDSYSAAHRHFLDCLRSGRPAETEAAANRNTLAAVFAAYQSAAGQRPVSVTNTQTAYSW